MTKEEMLARMLCGWAGVTGEFRGGRADLVGHVDRKTGLASQRVVVSYIVECWVSGGTGVVKIMQRLPESVTDPAQVKIELEKGRRYAFEVDAFSKESGFATAWMGLREPVQID